MSSIGIRRTALAACVATTAVSAFAGWNLLSTLMSELGGPAPQRMALMFSIIVYLSNVMLPVFYFVLYRYEGIIRIKGGFRHMAFVSAVIISIVVLTSLPEWLRYLQPTLVMLRGGAF